MARKPFEKPMTREEQKMLRQKCIELQNKVLLDIWKRCISELMNNGIPEATMARVTEVFLTECKL